VNYTTSEQPEPIVFAAWKDYVAVLDEFEEAERRFVLAQSARRKAAIALNYAIRHAQENRMLNP
jgi:hypothetical protein